MGDGVYAVLPSLEHLHYTAFEHVYEPAEDTFLLCDGLQQERVSLVARGSGQVIMELGSGSGTVITFIGQMLGGPAGVKAAGVTADRGEGAGTGMATEETVAVADVDAVDAYTYTQNCYMALDINIKALEMTRETGARNGVAVQVVRGDLFAGTRLPLPLDVLIFNPPYVPTPNDEVGGDGIEASWAGGECGREVIDRFLPLLPSLLAPPRACAGAGAGAGAGVGAGVVEGGVCYMILVEDNKPADVMAICTAMGLEAKIIRTKRARNELLHVVRVQRVLERQQGHGPSVFAAATAAAAVA